METLVFKKKKFIIVIILIVIIISAASVFAYNHVEQKARNLGFTIGNEEGYKNGHELGYQEGHNTGYNNGLKYGDSTGFTRAIRTKYQDLVDIKKEFETITYKFQPKIHYAKIVNNIASIGTSDKNGNYHEFNEIMNSINNELLEFMSKKFNLIETDKKYILKQFELESEQLNRQTYQNLVALNKQTHLSKNKTIFNRTSIDGVNNFDKVIGKYLNKYIGIFTKSITNEPYTPFIVKASVKEIYPHIATALINPFILELKKRAIIQDYSSSKITIEQQVSNQIAQFATAEVKTTSYNTFNFDKYIWGFKSNAIAKTYSIAKTKAGFDLMYKFELKIDNFNQEILIQFPKPSIISHEVGVEFKNLENGWVSEIQESQLNYINTTIENQLRDEAWYETNLQNDAVENAEELLRVIFSPISTSMPYPYTVKVKFGSEYETILIDHSNLSLDEILTSNSFRN